MTPQEKKLAYYALPSTQERSRERAREWYYANKARALSNVRRWMQENPEKVRAYHLKHRSKPENAGRINEYGRRWNKNNPEKKRATLARRRARKLKAMPSWVNKKELALVYKNCPEGLHVDHIVPLQGKRVSGLHVPWNLQYLHPTDNRRKGNSWQLSAKF